MVGGIIMDQRPFEPSRVTKPIQLLAAWLAGLILVNGSFLGAASAIQQPSWVPGFLVVASIVNVPLFLIFLFFLQTKFRPEMQEDTFYAKYLERKSLETQKTEYVKIEQNYNKFGRIELSETSYVGDIGKIDDFGIEINDLIDDYEQIVHSLISNGFRIKSTFGSTSGDPSKPPRVVISIDDGAELELVKSVVKIIEPFGIDYINISDAPYNRDSVYIGSYVYKNHQRELTKFNRTLMNKILSPQTDWRRLKTLVNTVQG